MDKGTNRYEFIKNYKKKIITASNNKKYYSWVDIGSEYRAPELSSALLYSQLKKLNFIQKKRKAIWSHFKNELIKLNSNLFTLLEPSKFSRSSYHLFIIIFKNYSLSKSFMSFMQNKGIAATFHYVPLHKSKMANKYLKKKLKITENIYSRVVRLPLFVGLEKEMIKKIVLNFKKFIDDQK